VLKALARDPDQRWQTAREMGHALRKFLATTDALIGPPELSNWMADLFPHGESRKDQLMELARMPYAPVLSIRAAGEFEETQMGTVSRLAPALPERRSAKRRRVGLLAAAAAVAIGVGVAAFVLGGDSERRSEQTLRAKVEPTTKGAADRQALAPSMPPELQPSGVDEPKPEAQARTAKPASKRRAQSKPRKSGKPGIVNLVTRGGWAEVFKNGKSLGSTPSTLTLPPGRHKLVLKRHGTGAPKRIVVTVKAGATKKVSVPLN
jgi:hypothetical protein